MLRQTISTTSRALRSTARLSTPRPTSSLPQLYQTSFATVRTIAPRTRWYSSETDAAKNNGEEAKKEAEVESPEAAFKKQLEAKDAEVRELKDKYLRSMAEQQNEFRSLQERTAREIQKNKEFALQGFAQDLVDTVDNFDRALAMVPEEKLKSQPAEEKSEHQQDLVNLYEGLKMTETILMQTLKKHGLERFDPNGDVFNPHEHDATFMTPMPDKEHNTVFHVQQKGFRLNGRILRPAKVGVVKNK
ncbi:GrpE-domain-containing protein [Parathielavia hyrcaniae]|uniref:GrpE protein homolog n=1 Tax=Parathielavia hyrcaniae TaxID=113614 RepID=A0AAN6SY97_9PEZI|nr:GrpE-domain-containing protein [Parathielavia hyrcaniae]